MFDFESLSLHHMITNPEFQECTMHGVVCVLVQFLNFFSYKTLVRVDIRNPFPAGGWVAWGVTGSAWTREANRGKGDSIMEM